KAFARANNQAAMDLFSVALLPNDPDPTNTGVGPVLFGTSLVPNQLAAQGRVLAPNPTGIDLPQWVEFGQNLPNAIVSAMSYTPKFTSPADGTTPVGDVLLVALRGRGVWQLTDASNNVGKQTQLNITADANGDTFALRLDPNHPAPLAQWVDVY